MNSLVLLFIHYWYSNHNNVFALCLDLIWDVLEFPYNIILFGKTTFPVLIWIFTLKKKRKKRKWRLKLTLCGYTFHSACSSTMFSLGLKPEVCGGSFFFNAFMIWFLELCSILMQKQKIKSQLVCAICWYHICMHDFLLSYETSSSEKPNVLPINSFYQQVFCMCLLSAISNVQTTL